MHWTNPEVPVKAQDGLHLLFAQFKIKDLWNNSTPFINVYSETSKTTRNNFFLIIMISNYDLFFLSLVLLCMTYKYT